MSRPPNTETAERRKARIENEQRVFLSDFDRQVAELEDRDRAKATAPSSDAPKDSAGR
jgi:hypothetical protein